MSTKERGLPKPGFEPVATQGPAKGCFLGRPGLCIRTHSLRFGIKGFGGGRDRITAIRTAGPDESQNW